MEKLITYLPYIVAGAGIWATGNGILHDIFILASDHGKQYDRNLLRLLMDGHVLITCGLILLFSYKGIKANHEYAFYTALIACISLLVYCGMIWPFLKSVLTIAINLFTAIVLAIALIKVQRP